MDSFKNHPKLSVLNQHSGSNISLFCGLAELSWMMAGAALLDIHWVRTSKVATDVSGALAEMAWKVRFRLSWDTDISGISHSLFSLPLTLIPPPPPPPSLSLSHQKIFTDSLLHARHESRCQQYSSNQDRNSAFTSLPL